MNTQLELISTLTSISATVDYFLLKTVPSVFRMICCEKQ